VAPFTSSKKLWSLTTAFAYRVREAAFLFEALASQRVFLPLWNLDSNNVVAVIVMQCFDTVRIWSVNARL
jgi:hypothetical protein